MTVEVNGYIAFKGTMAIHDERENEDYIVFAQWLYNPSDRTWYNDKGEKFPSEICKILNSF